MPQIISRVAQGSSLRVSFPTCTSGLGIGTPVLTADGVLPVEYLSPGDKIITRAAGLVELTEVITRTVPMRDLVRLRPSVLGDAGSGRDMVLSSQQKIVVSGWKARAMFGRDAALIEADRMVDGAYMSRLTGAAPMRLFQLRLKGAPQLIQVGHGLWLRSALSGARTTP